MYNKNEDFYAKIASNETPAHDVLLTNPPYSEDHVERLVRWASSGTQASRPFLALMPDFFASRPWFVELAKETGVQWRFLGPKDKPYVFTAPVSSEQHESISDSHR